MFRFVLDSEGEKNPSKLQGIREKVGFISKDMNVFIAIIFLSTILNLF